METNDGVSDSEPGSGGSIQKFTSDSESEEEYDTETKDGASDSEPGSGGSTQESESEEVSVESSSETSTLVSYLQKRLVGTMFGGSDGNASSLTSESSL